MTSDLYPRPRRRSWAEELDELIAAPAPECPPSLFVPAAAPPPVPVAVPEPRPARKRVPRAEPAPEAAIALTCAPDRQPPTFAELEAELAAKGIVNLGPKPLSKCGTCKALAPNHLTGCKNVRMPDPDAPRCGSCPYPSGSLGCRMACGDGGQ